MSNGLLTAVMSGVVLLVACGVGCVPSPGQPDGRAVTPVGEAVVPPREPAAEPPSTVPDANLKALVNGNNAFAIDLYKRLAENDGNIVISPYSVSSALTMTYAGARGKTAEEMAKVLGIRETGGDVHRARAELTRRLWAGKGTGRPEFLVANAFWRQTDLKLHPAYVQQCERDYGAEFRPADFVSNAEGARQAINLWAKAKTADKIDELVGAGALNDKTRFVLVNAVYFKGKWSAPFPKNGTKEGNFSARFKDATPVPMMQATLLTGYHSEHGIHVVAIPYADNRLSLYAFLGETEATLRDFESRLSPQVISDLIERLKMHVVNLSMPRFRLVNQFVLSELLSRLGMSTAFSPHADLSGIADAREGLRLGAVLHKSYLDIDEEGTEAAAATAVVGVTPISATEPPPRAQLALDRPFLFLIRDHETGTVTFVGRLSQP